MSTTGKALQVLALFGDACKELRAIDVTKALGISGATAYRYIADLQEAGLIERSSANQYVLGPTIVELDRQIRENDPLIAAAREIMKTLSERTGGTTLLSRLHGRKVICVHQVRGRCAPRQVSYERGRAMPLYRGATSRIILAHIDQDQLREMARQDAAALRSAGLPTAFEALSKVLAAWRAGKVCTTVGAIDPDAMGWAAAIHHGRQLLGSLSVVLACSAPRPARIADQLLRAALRIEGRVQSLRQERFHESA